MAATGRLLERALALLPNDDPRRPGLLVKLTEPLAESARLQEAYSTVEEVLASPMADEASRARALETVGLLFQLGWAAADVEPRVEEALAIRRRLGEPGGIARALLAELEVAWFRGQLGKVVQLGRRRCHWRRPPGTFRSSLAYEARSWCRRSSRPRDGGAMTPRPTKPWNSRGGMATWR